MVPAGHNTYKKNSENMVVSKDQILMKLLDGCLNFMTLAKRGTLEKNPKVKGENISKVLAIISELDCALDHQKGGELAENLSMLYQHIMYTMVQANINNDIEAMENIEGIIKEIREGFEIAIKTNNTPKINSEPSKEGMRLAV